MLRRLGFRRLWFASRRLMPLSCCPSGPALAAALAAGGCQQRLEVAAVQGSPEDRVPDAGPHLNRPCSATYLASSEAAFVSCVTAAERAARACFKSCEPQRSDCILDCRATATRDVHACRATAIEAEPRQ